jgi:hypothetical protein
MKKIKEMRFALVILALIFSINLSAQESSKEVKITASGSGATLEDAKQSALRSATEQAFGAFISSKTEVFNDQVVADQMSSVSSGNIKSYEVLNEDQLPDGRWGTTIQAIVSVDKLTSFVQAKGIEVEIKGGLFALNIKQQLLNEQGEIEAVYAMVGLLHEPMQTAFDYTIKSGDPKSTDAESKNWEIPLEVTATCNKNMDFCANYFIKTLRALSLTVEEVSSYQALNKKVFPLNVTYDGETEVFNLRKESSLAVIRSLISNWEFYTRLFVVKSGIDESNGNGDGTIHKIRNNSDELRNKNDYELSSVFFLKSGQVAATFSWKDERTLSQIERMTGYIVNPRGCVSFFKNGGFVVMENDGHGLIVSLQDIGCLRWTSFNHRECGYEWNNAVLACEELVLNGYSDWRLPAIEEMRAISENLDKFGVGNLTKEPGIIGPFYWCGANPGAGIRKDSFSFSVGSLYDNWEGEHLLVRAVRTF